MYTPNTTLLQERQIIEKALESNTRPLKEIQQAAFQAHADVNQMYDKIHPYSLHLEMVATNARQYIGCVCTDENDLLPIIFGAYFHDSIEDARYTYNDILKTARQFMDEKQALLATELVYALTNEKGRTRAERAGEKYYQGIRAIPYAPFLKACDRLANMNYSHQQSKGFNNNMANTYAKELPHFLEQLRVETSDPRFQIPSEMLKQFKELTDL